MTAPTNIISTVEAAIVTQLQTVPSLSPNAGGTVRGVADIKTFYDLTALEPPSVIVVFDGERAKPDMTIGVVTQQTEMFWTLYLVASSFGTDSEGRTSAYQMVEDVLSVMEGFPLALDGVIQTKFTYIGTARYHVADTVVIYELRLKHQFLRQG